MSKKLRKFYVVKEEYSSGSWFSSGCTIKTAKICYYRNEVDMLKKECPENSNGMIIFYKEIE